MVLKIDIAAVQENITKYVAGLKDRFDTAYMAAANMARSMLEQVGRADIASASGNFGESWTQGLHVTLNGSMPNMLLSMTHDIPFAGIFETGGTIQGKPLLWIPLSGTDAAGVRASAFGGGLFSARYPRTSGPPLLFSIADKRPRYVGVSTASIPKLFHLHEDAESVMSNFRSFFDQAWQES